MADNAADARFLEIITRLEALEAAMDKPKESEEEDEATKPELRRGSSAKNESPTVYFEPRLNRVNWAQFKNSVVGESRYTIDVLIGPIKSHWARRQEELNIQRNANGSPLNQGISSSNFNQPTEPAILDSPTATNERLESQIVVPERIRINCEKLLATLSDIVESTIGPEPVVLLRPYKLLIRHDKALRQRLWELQALRGKAMQEIPKQDASIDDSRPRHLVNDNGTDQVQEEYGSNANSTEDYLKKESTDDRGQQTELEGLQCLVEFMDTYVTPVYQRYRSSTPKKVHFRDLWYLYRPGDLVVTRRNIDDHKSKELDTAIGDQAPSSQMAGKGPPAIWRVLSASRGRPDLESLHGNAGGARPPLSKVNDFSISCHVIAYDGTSFGPLGHTFIITPFEGQKEIVSLDPCPVRYVENYADIEARLVDRGKRFVQYTSPSHCLYAGLTLSQHQIGQRCDLADKNTIIDGHVIVDFKEAKREEDAWVPELGMPDIDSGANGEISEDYPRSIWKDKAHKMLEKTESDTIYDDDVDNTETDDLVASNPFLAAYKDASRKEDIDHRVFQRIDFALLPDRVVGFDLYRRKFAILALDSLQPVRANREGWADLKLPVGHKQMVQAQIRTHFLRKGARQNRTVQDTDADLVRGKGLGLIILLHGAPGVGKTSTAECVAESLGKPLYPITCGDLGVTAESVEQTLARTFTKAEAWDCVLLLDEADVFLAQRTRTDLERNAIVSVFLRVLEYYKGTLILTTNRVGAFDEAFKSRIHLNLYYPALNKAQTLAIWKMNLDRIMRRKQGRITVNEQEILQFAEKLFERQNKSTTRWNGRQIRNAFQTALAMAEYEALGEAGLAADWELLENLQSALKVAHFETVAEASSQFDSYIEETIGGTDAKRAFMDRERADHFRWYVPVNAHSEHRTAQWPYTAAEAHSSYHQATSDPFTLSSIGRQGESFTAQESASVQTSFRHGQAWTSPQQPWAAMGSSPARPPQEPDAPHPYLLRAPDHPAWAHKQDHSDHGFPSLAHTQFDTGRPPPPLTPSNRDHRSVAHMPVRLGASQSQDEDGY